MRYDMWFCRVGPDLYANVSDADKPDEPPMSPPRKVVDVGTALRRVRFAGHEVVQVGILPPELIGLEVEV